MQTGLSPKDCLLLFGIPTDKTDFLADLERTDKDFTQLFNGQWLRYEHQFVAPFRQMHPELLKKGLTICERGTLDELTVACENFRVVILFSHWLEGQVEFADGLKTITEICTAVPPDFNGILDLCVCHPDGLAEHLRIHRPHCVVKYTTTQATPLLWLNFYQLLFNYLSSHPDDYLSAITKLTKAYANSSAI